MTHYSDIIGKREIEFRALILHNDGTKEWYYYSTTTGNLISNLYCSVQIRRVIASDLQYTGLKDKNCTKIFEGDIVQYLCQKETTQVLQTYVVVFHYDSFCKLMDGEHYAFGFSQNGTLLKEKVIGNIFENPELTPTQL